MEMAKSANTTKIGKQGDQRGSGRHNKRHKQEQFAWLPKELWWLDFLDDGRLLGVSVVYASNMMEAVREAWRLDINPGGTVIAYDMEEIPVDMIGRFTPIAELASRGLVTPKTRH
jgi:hypothetical protein